MTKSSCAHRTVDAVSIAGRIASVGFAARASAQARVIELTADSDSRYKIAGMRTPEITVKVGEQILLRVTARKKAKRGIAMDRFMVSPCCVPRIVPRWMVGTCSSSRGSKSSS